MRVAVDTNVLVSGLLWHGPPHALIEAIREGKLQLVASPALLAELADVIGRPKFASILARAATTRERLLAEIGELAELIEPAPLTAPVCRDPDDDALIALAIAAQAEVIVTGDDDLLALGGHSGIRIIGPAAAVKELG